MTLQAGEKYDAIGIGYDDTRRADPKIAVELADALCLKPNAPVLDIGCGTGNYTCQLADFGFRMTGADPSSEMLSSAKSKRKDISWVRGSAENMPFGNEVFVGAVAVLTIHHWQNLQKGFSEIRRVLASDSRLVIFSSTPEQTNAYWLKHYFPEAIESATKILPTRETIELTLSKARFRNIRYVPWNVPSDLIDHFWYSGKDRPELYLDAAYRKGISGFRVHCSDRELKEGLAKLQSDIESGRWHDVRARADHDGGDYCFVIAESAD